MTRCPSRPPWRIGRTWNSTWELLFLNLPTFFCSVLCNGAAPEEPWSDPLLQRLWGRHHWTAEESGSLAGEDEKFCHSAPFLLLNPRASQRTIFTQTTQIFNYRQRTQLWHLLSLDWLSFISFPGGENPRNSGGHLSLRDFTLPANFTRQQRKSHPWKVNLRLCHHRLHLWCSCPPWPSSSSSLMSMSTMATIVFIFDAIVSVENSGRRRWGWQTTKGRTLAGKQKCKGRG